MSRPIRKPFIPKPVLPEVGSSLRMVFEHLSGRRAGLHQILGVSPAPYPDLAGLTVDGAELPTPFNLVRVHRGAVYFRELGISDPNRPKHFDPRQA